ncbi:MAG: hypothetical protein RJB01_593 [Actinomycetota bacterium]
MDPVLFLRDIERTPETLNSLADDLNARNPWLAEPAMAAALEGVRAGNRLILLGMGSSHFANSVLAMRLQAVGVHAIAVLASTDPLPAVDPHDVVIAVSASGGSAETLAAVELFRGQCMLIAVTNTEGSAIEASCDAHVALRAEVEVGGVACRSFTHTIGVHLALEDALNNRSGEGTIETINRAAEACEDLLSRRAEWLAPTGELLLGPDGTAVVAPARRLSSAQQSALMLREGPRLPAIACETGDWSHIDVYLTKTTDYRMLLLPGSRWEPQLMDWCTQRNSTLVALGADIPGTQLTLRYRHDDLEDVRLFVEPLVCELIAQGAWAAGLVRR